MHATNTATSLSGLQGKRKTLLSRLLEKMSGSGQGVLKLCASHSHKCRRHTAIVGRNPRFVHENDLRAPGAPLCEIKNLPFGMSVMTVALGGMSAVMSSAVASAVFHHLSPYFLVRATTAFPTLVASFGRTLRAVGAAWCTTATVS